MGRIIEKGQVVSFRPHSNLLRRDSTVIKKLINRAFGTLYEISIYASPSELSKMRSSNWSHKKLKKVIL